MPNVLERLYSATEGALVDLKGMSGQPDTKIGKAAAETFNALLKESKGALPVPLIQSMTELNDQDPFMALIMRLRVLMAELGAAAFRE
jgi:hypothetical protein